MKQNYLVDTNGITLECLGYLSLSYSHFDAFHLP